MFKGTVQYTFLTDMSDLTKSRNILFYDTPANMFRVVYIVYCFHIVNLSVVKFFDIFFLTWPELLVTHMAASKQRF